MAPAAQALYEAEGAANFAKAHPKATNVVQTVPIATAQRMNEPMPTLKLGTMAELLGFTVTADFLKSLGFEPAATDRASKLYHSEDFPLICRALIEHIESVCETA